MAATSDAPAPGRVAGPARPPRAVGVGVYDRYESLTEVKAYYGVLAIYALARLADRYQDRGLLARVERILARFPDEVDHPPYNFASYRIGGCATAYEAARGRATGRHDLLAEYAEEMMTAPRDARGILEHIAPPRGRIWIDVAMAAAPFLLYAGRALDRPEYVDEAVHQAVALHDALLDTATGLLHQCEGFLGAGVRSTDHWGRGNGWGHLALAELAAGLSEDHPGHADVVARFVALSARLLPYQSRRGLWRQELPDPGSWEESSGTGLITYSLGRGIEAGVLDPQTYGPAVRRGIAGLGGYAVNPDWSTENSCPGTLCPGDGTARAYVELREPHRDEVHSFAAIILAMSVAPVVGVESVALRAARQTTTYLEAADR
ncbi:glycoside hydrolase family 88 protein [Jiangella endophytica]|uniref:glycoside hydrolase family 88 protein n=1 Tax=Jiangella endophytica TaxID=1623398 RepID=UPI000E355A4A|nr:glycoside hydrolase family 88 protein [Jiangella endophytica]